MGVSTVGFRTQKYNPAESSEVMYARFRQILSDLNNAENVNKVSREIISKIERNARQIQFNSTRHLKDRVGDITLWKNQLCEEIKETALEIIQLNEFKTRLEKAQLAHEIINMIVSDNLNAREHRDGVDKVQDNVELGLLKELEITNSAMELLKRTLKQCEEQIKRNKNCKHEMEMDWSDKKEAHDNDCFNASLKEDSRCKQFYPAAAKFQEIQSTPESWAQFTHDNLAKAEQERMSSIQLRCLIDNLLDTTANDIRKQADDVNFLFNNRIKVLSETLWKLNEDLTKVNKMVYNCELNIETIKRSIKNYEELMKVAQTRLRNRENRPNVELTRDPAQYSLVSEVNELARSLDALIQKTNESESALKDMLDERTLLEKNKLVVEYSIFIDREKCLPHRTRYPSKMKLLGYQ
ncbi:hypothetical protein HELRODRAFT_65637 [Helobdella robusta]|uniref:Tektin n=1 Tax=Helobdella robusta TaxID=6412 RepID=T1FYB0_HELRO|nr:hypothetical protein HELRODRAFT_65637 [Helobdella robusta]ESO02100.1 hypothetical protein HELRODRAFT_65637 [Helobdella robusta]